MKFNTLILLFSIVMLSCTSSNNYEFEFYTNDISACRRIIYSSQTKHQLKIIEDKKVKENQRIRRNEITVLLAPNQIDSIVKTIENETTISCKKVFRQADLDKRAQKAAEIEFKLSIVYSK